jgi:large subunit ribosomal protein L15
MDQKFTPIPISRIQQFIATNRLSAEEPITIRSLIQCNAVHGLGKTHGVKLLGDIDESLPLPPVTVYLSRFSKSAAKAILDNGGQVKAFYYNRESLRAERLSKPDVEDAYPKRKKDICEFQGINP